MENSFVLITNGNLFTMIALGEWLARFGHLARKIYITRKLPSSKGNIRGVARMYAKSGFDYTYFKVWANKLLPIKLRMRGLPASVEQFMRACGYNTPVVGVNNVNTDEIISEIKNLQVDYLVSSNATQKFEEPLITTPVKAAINAHYSALPAYAGLSPYFWYLFNEEDNFGVTVHQIVLKLDAGPIIEQAVGTMEGARTALEVMNRMVAHVSPMLIGFFDGQTTLEAAKPQDQSGRSYFRHPTRQQMRQFRQKGFATKDRPSAKAAARRVQELAELAAEVRASQDPRGEGRRT